MVDLPEALRLVQQLNPGISDLNRIRTGQTILLPAADVINFLPRNCFSGKSGEQLFEDRD
jgi:hypothetical protein